MGDPIKCHECGILEPTEEHFPFCSKLCHVAWAAVNYKDAKPLKKKGEDLKEKLKKWKF